MATYYPSTPFPVQFINPDTGELLSGGVLRAYLAGTTTPTPMYTNGSGTSAGTSVTLNAGGYPTHSNQVIVIWLEVGIDYKFVLEDDDENGKWSVDNILSITNSFLASNVFGVCKTVADMTSASGPLLTNGQRLTSAMVSAAADGGALLETTMHNTTSKKGGAKYEIISDAERVLRGLSSNEYTCIPLMSGSSFFACILPENNTLKLTQIGAYTSKDDCFDELVFGINYCAANKLWLDIDGGSVFETTRTLPVISNMKIGGQGTIKLKSGSNVKVFDNLESPVTEIENVHMKDFTVDGNRTGQTSLTVHNDGIKINYCDNLVVENLTVKSCGTPDTSAGANNAVGLSLHECINFKVSKCRFSDCQHYNFQTWECVDGVVEGNVSINPGSHCFGGAANLRVKFLGNTAAIIWSQSNFTYDAAVNAGQGFWFRQYEDCVVSNNTVYRQTDGVSARPAGAAIQNGQEASLGSTTQSTRLQGILVPSGSINGTIYSNNTITGDFEFGIYGYSGKSEKMITRGNRIYNTWKSGIIVTSNRLISHADVLENCGSKLGSALEISAATAANPCVITCAAHGFTNNTVVYISSATGMTELNGRYYTIQNATTNTFELQGVDSTAYTAYVSGGYVCVQNAAIWAQGRDHHISSPTIINADGVGIYCQGVRSIISDAKIEGYGQKIKSTGIYIRDFSNDVTVSNPSVYTDTPASESYNAIYLGDSASRFNLDGGNLFNQPAAGSEIRLNSQTDHSMSGVIGVTLAAADRYKLSFRTGSVFQWVDSTGDLRVKTSAPSSDTDGTVVGTQT